MDETAWKCYALLMDNFGNWSMEEHPDGEWIRFEEVQQLIQNLFKARNIFEWASAVVELRNLKVKE